MPKDIAARIERTRVVLEAGGATVKEFYTTSGHYVVVAVLEYPNEAMMTSRLDQAASTEMARFEVLRVLDSRQLDRFLSSSA